MTRLSVSKWQGTGNDFVLLDNPSNAEYPYPDMARALCDRRYGIGADGLIVLLPPRDGAADLAMRIFNADGTEAQMCGNGIRCVALARLGSPSGGSLAIETAAGIVRTSVIANDLVRVNMGKPKLLRRDIPMAGPPDAKAIGAAIEIAGKTLRVCALSMGNPHCVVFAEGDALVDQGRPLHNVDLPALAASLGDETLFPEGVNVEIAAVLPVGVESRIAMRVFERGVGETPACGSGACAVAVAAMLTGRANSPASIVMPGGSVTVEWDRTGGDVTLTGPAKLSFRADVDVDV